MPEIHDRKAWLKARKTGLGGSDMPAVIGVSRFTSPMELWLEKVGYVEEEESTGDMKRGKGMEPMIRDMYQEREDREVLPAPEMMRHPEHSWMIANPDGLLEDEEMGHGVWEAKCPRSYTFATILREGLSYEYVAQGQHYLAVSGREFVSYAIFDNENWKMIVLSVRRNEKIIAHLIEIGQEFWHCVETRTPPDGLPALRLPQGRKKQELVTVDAPEWTETLRRLHMARRIEREAKKLKEKSGLRIQAMMGDLEHVQGGGAVVHCTQKEGYRKLDLEALKSAHPEIDLERFYARAAPKRVPRVYFDKEYGDGRQTR